MSTTELRIKLAEARNTIRASKLIIEDVEHNVRERLLTACGGDVKQIGSNQELREDRYRSAYGAEGAWIRAKADLLQASEDAEILQAVLDGRVDALTERRLAADEKRTDVIGRLVESGASVGAVL